MGIAAIGSVGVQANGNSWQNAVPVFGTDYSARGGAIFSPFLATCGVSPFACP